MFPLLTQPMYLKRPSPLWLPWRTNFNIISIIEQLDKDVLWLQYQLIKVLLLICFITVLFY